MAEVVETETFAKWLKGLRDRIARRNILRRIARIASTDNFGDHASVGGGVSELRVHFGPGYRLYYTIREEKIVLLLCGGVMGKEERATERAKEMAAALE